MIYLKRKTVLLVEGNSQYIQRIEESLADTGSERFMLKHAETLSSALQQLAEVNTDAIILDLDLTGGKGLQIFDHIHAVAPQTPIILLIGLGDEQTALKAIRAGAQTYLFRDHLTNLAEALNRALHIAHIRWGNNDGPKKHPDGAGFFRNLAEKSNHLIYRYRVASPRGFEYVNPAIESITGYPPEAYYTDPDLLLDRISPEDRCHLQRIWSGETEPQVMTHRLGHLQGEIYWVEHHTFSLLNQEGETVAIDAIALDITEQMRAKEDSEASGEQYRSLFENIPDGVYRSTVDGKLLAVNPAMIHMLGYESEDELRNINAVDLYAKQESRQELMDAFLGGRDVHVVELHLKRKNGQKIIVRDNARAIRDEHGEIVHFEGTLTDITQLKETEKNLQRSIESAEHGRQLLLALSQAAEQIQRARHPSEVFKVVGDKINEFGFHVGILTLIEDCQTLHIAHYTGQPAFIEKAMNIVEFDLDSYRIPLAENKFLMHLISEPKTVFHSQIKDLIAATLPKSQQHFANQITSLLNIDQGITAPLSIGGEIRGIMVVAGSDMEQVDQEAITAFSNQTGIAWENALLFEALEQSQEELQGIYEGVQDAILVENSHGDILDANQRACELYGYSKEELVHLNVSDLVPAEHPKIISRDYPDGELPNFPIETVNQRANGEHFPIEITTRLQTIGNEVLTLAVVRDITERKHDQEIIDHQIEHMEVLRHIDQAIVETLDLGVTLEVVLEQLAKHLKMDSAAVLLIDKDPDILKFAAGHGFSSKDFQHMELRLGESYAGQIAQSLELLIVEYLRKVSGGFSASQDFTEEGFVTYIGVPLLVKGNLLGVLELFQRTLKTLDEGWLECLEMLVTQAAIAINSGQLHEGLARYSENLEQAVETATEELRRSKERVETILSNSPDAVLLLTPLGIIRMINQTLEQTFEFTAAELLGKPFCFLVERESEEICNHTFQTTRERGETHRTELLAKRKDGGSFDAELALSPIMFEGELQGVVATIRDISILKQVERMKDSFVSNVSHELRTPITSIKLNYGLINMNPDKKEEYLIRLGREIDRLSTLTEDLLRLSRLDTGKVALALAPVSLNDSIEQYVSDRQIIAANKGLTLTFQEEHTKPQVYADEGLIGQVLSVLLTNAINYTPSGGAIRVTAQSAIKDGETWCGFSVEDTGPGIADEDLPYLFERFYRGLAARELGVPGTGLGLSIAEEIVNRHQGSLEIQNLNDGKGAKFSVWLPSCGKEESIPGANNDDQ